MAYSNIDEAYGTLLSSHWEKQENPQHYNELSAKHSHPTPHRHMLGLVGGNEASLIKGNMVDLESDLRGINLPITFNQARQYQRPESNQKEIVRDNTKISGLKIDVQPVHLPACQMMAYPAVMAPAPLINEVCMRPEKY